MFSLGSFNVEGNEVFTVYSATEQEKQKSNFSV